MIYPEQVLKQKFEEIGLELDRIRDVLGKHKPDTEMGKAIIKLTKRQKDLADAINILRDASTVDESGDTRPIIKTEK